MTDQTWLFFVTMPAFRFNFLIIEVQVPFRSYQGSTSVVEIKPQSCLLNSPLAFFFHLHCRLWTYLRFYYLDNRVLFLIFFSANAVNGKVTTLKTIILIATVLDTKIINGYKLLALATLTFKVMFLRIVSSSTACSFLLISRDNSSVMSGSTGLDEYTDAMIPPWRDTWAW